MAGMASEKGRRPGRWIALLLIAAAGGMLVAPASALGQAAVDQYIPDADPTGRHGQAGGPGSAAPLGPTGAGIPAADKTGGDADSGSGSAGGGDLLGTDYPATSFVAIIAAILVIALGLRLLWPALSRRLGHSGSS